MLRRIEAFLDESYAAPFRRQQRRSQRRQEDLFRLLVMSEALGVPNPAAFYCLELMPFLLEDFHAWHRRMGMEHSPVDGFRCC
ncbi:MAG: DNA helicase [Gammaproteobacteria bacterium]|nr:DNA helicase [Gammaproteobacteria bacterium]